jgi:transcription elongation factor Elf1
MTRKSLYNIPKLFWRCPHCGFEHSPADLMRVDWDQLQCKGCGKSFTAGPGEERK